VANWSYPPTQSSQPTTGRRSQNPQWHPLYAPHWLCLGDMPAVGNPNLLATAAVLVGVLLLAAAILQAAAWAANTLVWGTHPRFPVARPWFSLRWRRPRLMIRRRPAWLTGFLHMGRFSMLTIRGQSFAPPARSHPRWADACRSGKHTSVRGQSRTFR
jgi:hypothetical protein